LNKPCFNKRTFSLRRLTRLVPEALAQVLENAIGTGVGAHHFGIEIHYRATLKAFNLGKGAHPFGIESNTTTIPAMGLLSGPTTCPSSLRSATRSTAG